MTVAKLSKLSLVGALAEKDLILTRLQDLGCMHVLPLVPPPAEPEKISERGAKDAYKAVRFLADVATPRRQIREDPEFDVDAFIKEVLETKQRSRDVMDRRDFLAQRIADVLPWGDFDFPPEEELAGNRLWFYKLPKKHQSALENVETPCVVLGEDSRFLYTVLIAEDEPDADVLPIGRTHIGALPIRELQIHLEKAEIDLEAIEAERVAQTRYLNLLQQNIAAVETAAELAHAKQKVLEDETLFAVQGWVPNDRIEEVESMIAEAGAALLTEEPGPDEIPPTLLEQPEGRQAGVDLALFYQVPGYRDWDPSIIVSISFAIFFAMIVADAGYGIVLLLGLFAYWKKLDTSVDSRSWRRFGVIIAGCTIAYGIAVGSYFGVAPSEETLLASFKIMDLNDFNTMMMLSIVIGILHLVLANALAAKAAWGQRKAFANLGWIGVLIGGFVLWLASINGHSAVPGVLLMALGVGAIVFYSSNRVVQKPSDQIWRLLEGLQSLSGAMGAFGDVLSYMRLFALGLASASLAITFNDLATAAMQSLKGPGILLGVLILLIGHMLNFGLALMSGVVHGLRLNYIEFYKWGLPEEGVVFRPFTRKEFQK